MKIWNIYQTTVLNPNHTSVNLKSMNHVIHSNFVTFIKARLKRPVTQSTSHEICYKDISDETSSQNDPELLEDQATLAWRQNMIGDPLLSIVQFDNMENCIFNCAPSENNIPKYVLLDDDFELLAFPDLFPYGCGGYNYTDRSVKLPIRKYFQQLLNVDGHFAQNMEYIFCAQYIVDLKHIQSEKNLAL